MFFRIALTNEFSLRKKPVMDVTTEQGKSLFRKAVIEKEKGVFMKDVQKSLI